MILKKLRPEDSRLTRPLWERVFDEDTEEFLNYYYSVRTEDNEIYVIEKDGDIHAMLHLNPYVLQVGQKEEGSRYIVAVATDILYRGQGLMTELLQKAVRDMYARKLPFAFLMPASEQIYYPHHFRFIYAAEQWKAEGRPGEKLTAYGLLGRGAKGGQVTLSLARPKDCQRLARFAEEILRKKYNVYAKRTRHYYEVLLKEQASENGGILIAEKDGEIRGTVLFDEENGFAVREPILAPGYRNVFDEAGLHLKKLKKRKPMIMARILHVESLLACMKCREEMELEFWLVDPVIRENNRLFTLKGNEERTVVRTRAAKPGETVQKISVDALTTLVFGYKSVEETEKEEQETFSDEFKKELEKLIPLNKVFLNEIV